MAGIDFQSLMKDGTASPVTPGEQMDLQTRLALATMGTAQPQTPVQPQQPATPNPQVTPGGGGETDVNTNKWKGMLGDPRVKAGFLQMGASLLAGQGVGSSIGQGLAATGRAGVIQSDAEKEAAALAARAAGRGGSGGSGSGGAKADGKLAGLDMDFDGFNDYLNDYYESLGFETDMVPNLNPGQRMQLWDMVKDVDGMGGNVGGFLDDYLQNPAGAAAKYAAAKAAMERKPLSVNNSAPTAPEPTTAPAPSAPTAPKPAVGPGSTGSSTGRHVNRPDTTSSGTTSTGSAGRRDDR